MKRLLLIAATVLLTLQAGAQTTPHWLRRSSISPDGQAIAFAWQGDIWTVSVNGGQAKQITTNTAYDSDPLWTEDGKSIVFSSYRELSKDIWVVNAEGGSPVRLTTYNGNETPLTVWNSEVYYFANIQPDASFHEFPMGRSGQL